MSARFLVPALAALLMIAAALMGQQPPQAAGTQPNAEKHHFGNEWRPGPPNDAERWLHPEVATFIGKWAALPDNLAAAASWGVFGMGFLSALLLCLVLAVAALARWRR